MTNTPAILNLANYIMLNAKNSKKIADQSHNLIFAHAPSGRKKNKHGSYKATGSAKKRDASARKISHRFPFMNTGDQLEDWQELKTELGLHRGRDVAHTLIGVIQRYACGGSFPNVFPS